MMLEGAGFKVVDAGLMSRLSSWFLWQRNMAQRLLVLCAVDHDHDKHEGRCDEVKAAAPLARSRS